MKSWMCMPVLLASLSFSGCGGGSASTTTPPPSTYTIGGTASGILGTGLVLLNNGGNNLPLNANGGFTFTNAVASGGAYSVTVLTQPSSPSQTCAATNGTGTASANVTKVQVACTTVTYTIGGTVSALSGTGLVVQDNGGDSLPVSANGTFTFITPVASGGTYSVTVLTQPSNPAQSCTVTSGSGNASANVTAVQVVCGTITYTIGGTVSGLSGTGLVLQDNNGNNLSVGANQTSFTFTTPLASGSTYNVLVLTQPSSPAQSCVVTGGAGTANANVTSVLVACTSSGAPNEWTWVNGANVANQLGSYGSQGTPAPGNVPGARSGSATWTDVAGDRWLFGGWGYDSVSGNVALNDLWRYSAGEWTWMVGSNLGNQPGTYGTLGIPAPGNVPGAREFAVNWVDASGSLWLFGGVG